jgi:hypothetical protein
LGSLLGISWPTVGSCNLTPRKQIPAGPDQDPDRGSSASPCCDPVTQPESPGAAHMQFPRLTSRGQCLPGDWPGSLLSRHFQTRPGHPCPSVEQRWQPLSPLPGMGTAVWVSSAFRLHGAVGCPLPHCPTLVHPQGGERRCKAGWDPGWAARGPQNAGNSKGLMRVKAGKWGPSQ